MVSKLTGLVACAATISMLARGAAAGIVFVIHTPHCVLLLIDTDDGFLSRVKRLDFKSKTP